MAEKLCSLRKKGGKMSETVLWTNPSPTSALDDSILSLSDSLSNYKYLKCRFRRDTTDSTENAFLISIDDFKNTVATGNGVPWSCASVMISDNSRTRYAGWASDTSIRITKAWSGGKYYYSATEAVPIEFCGLR